MLTVTLKVIAFGTSTGVVLPQEMLARLGVEEGSTLYAIETEDGYVITPHDPGIGDEVAAGREFLKEYRDSFKALAE